MKRVVLDTNVLIDGARDEHSASARIIRDVLDGTLTAIVSHPLAGEYEQILPRAVADPRYLERVREFLRVAERADLRRVAAVVEEDPEDSKVLATAVAGETEALVTSDRHLLAMDPYDGVRILTPKAFQNLRAEDESAWSNFARTIGIHPKH